MKPKMGAEFGVCESEQGHPSSEQRGSGDLLAIDGN